MVRHAAAALSLVALPGFFVRPAEAQPCTPENLFVLEASQIPNSASVEVVTGDFNADGRLDFAAASLHFGSIGVRLNLAGGFQAAPSISVPAATNMVTGDFNGDGRVDLAVTAFAPTYQVHILLGSGNGTFSTGPLAPEVTAEPRGIATGDFNEDGITDLAVASIQGINVLLGLGAGGIGNGTFAPRVVHGITGLWGVTVADVNADGILDLAGVGLGASGVSVLLGRGANGVGDGTFNAPYTVGAVTAREIVSADFNADGIVDFATAGNSMCVLLGRAGVGIGQFTTHCYMAGRAFNGVTVADFDLDGIPDVAATEPSINRVVFLKGLANGFLAGAEFYPCDGDPVGIAHGRFRVIGGLDLLVAAASVSVLRGTCTPSPQGAPIVTGFAPAGGRSGDVVTIFGQGFASPPTLVEFSNGVLAEVLQVDDTHVQTAVPAGAVSGPIRVYNLYGWDESDETFLVGELPVITDTSPDSARGGTRVTIIGSHFANTIRVSFGGTGSAPFTMDSEGQITATVDAEATTGPVHVRTQIGTGVSPFDFVVIPTDSVPRIVAVRDVPSDQGGLVSVGWWRSDLDDPTFRQITGYRVWRRAPPAAARAASMELMQTLERGPDGALTTVFWEALATLPAAFLEGYAYVAPTTQDSMETGNPHAAFFVQALTADPFVFYSSAVDSGYSVDNLSPATPATFAGDYTRQGVDLHWGKSPEADLFGYRLYRGGSPGFVPGPGNLIAAQPDTGYFDPAGTVSSFYKLAAVDIHGNRSRFALVAPDRPTWTLASLAGTSAEPDRIRITWDASANPGLPATVYRRTPATSWIRVADVAADGNGRIVYEDLDIAPGGLYGYRLGILDAGVEAFFGEAWVQSPWFALAIASIRPNPSAGRFEVEFTLAAGVPATIELLDVSGRRVDAREVQGAAAGRGSLRFEAPPALPPGIYLLRLIQGGTRATAKVALLQ